MTANDAPKCLLFLGVSDDGKEKYLLTLENDTNDHITVVFCEDNQVYITPNIAEVGPNSNFDVVVLIKRTGYFPGIKTPIKFRCLSETPYRCSQTIKLVSFGSWRKGIATQSKFAPSYRQYFDDQPNPRKRAADNDIVVPENLKSRNDRKFLKGLKGMKVLSKESRELSSQIEEMKKSCGKIANKALKLEYETSLIQEFSRFTKSHIQEERDTKCHTLKISLPTNHNQSNSTSEKYIPKEDLIKEMENYLLALKKEARQIKEKGNQSKIRLGMLLKLHKPKKEDLIDEEQKLEHLDQETSRIETDNSVQHFLNVQMVKPILSRTIEIYSTTKRVESSRAACQKWQFPHEEMICSVCHASLKSTTCGRCGNRYLDSCLNDGESCKNCLPED